ncbi:hypothetical protein RhiirA5_406845 [Rhizophagus irregularis]|uniref:Uncharacterized protein n=3 Tax=Rhizophagus irregularis TaxID=588596 RepID=A0A2I1EDX8_9GLOM|nr:hypothetical protein GLOIN_2v1867293 [Rhizophagus irregularis DAOM 181602=DAOM 197198]PKC16605.1 hypothetical protein RhiirA5_406845 [Rhizophagus irregularis]PKY20309.1 hypothetical protein RhiirB3_433579 [Rhizophagus irregularis]POG82555.1 hypothetical protein GLOIN_2v1867293 [Rhizophagus irregularis DAOM 181602=DAOM 197198]CAB5386512.1 unnamed protein product [Rhizophagus irregularis]GBC24166.2 hypothetical protein GLOIN_2v1867293 [Rhizophagus irregularis DAOM 181602=DAOM 197198]|eukprot:XP_025189421.1 hypothetical protein GLOIN_2v1867293 [Rhizophagus irregularis DAOM 181602=DAOM 197198]
MFFLIDSCSWRKTEPFWFGIFRCGVAFILTCIILKFSIYDNFNKIFHQTVLEQLDVPIDSKMVIETSMCANDAMEAYFRPFPLGVVRKNITSAGRCMSFPLPTKIPDFASGLRSGAFWIDIEFPLNGIENSTINDNQLDYIINSYYNDKAKLNNSDYSSILPNNYLKLTINMTLNILNTEINCIGYSPKAFYFRPGQAFFIHIKSSTNSYLNSCDLELDLQSEQLPLNLDTNRIGLGFNIYFPFRYNSMVIYDFESYLSDIGGFYGSIEGFFASIFGSGKLGPWGIAQTIILTSIPCVRSFGRNFARVYVSKGGIPLVEDVKDRPKKSGYLNSLEERVQILETLLKEYYLDEHYLEKIKYFADSRKELNKKEVPDEEKAEEQIIADDDEIKEIHS